MVASEGSESRTVTIESWRKLSILNPNVLTRKWQRTMHV